MAAAVSPVRLGKIRRTKAEVGIKLFAPVTEAALSVVDDQGGFSIVIEVKAKTQE